MSMYAWEVVFENKHDSSPHNDIKVHVVADRVEEAARKAQEHKEGDGYRSNLGDVKSLIRGVEVVK